MAHNFLNTFQTFTPCAGRTAKFYSLPQLEKEGLGAISRLPVSIRIVLESVLRNLDESRVTAEHVRGLAAWSPDAARTDEIPFVVARILLQDFTGVPLLVDLAAMRSAAVRLGKDPRILEPLVPVDLVIDHSIQVDFASVPDAFRLNMEMEFKRNNARYRFLKWGMQAFQNFNVVPPGIGICHQVNLEYLARGVLERDGIFYPDTLVGTDSHTTMINGLGIVGWGVGGIEAEAGMLGQPVYILTPDVVGVHMTGALRPGVTATDLVLYCTEMLRRAKVVGKFVEYHGEGAATLAVTDRATIANMAPEYGATMGFFPIDEQTCAYLEATGREPDRIESVRSYFKAQGMFGMPRRGECNYSTVLELDLEAVEPSVAGPKRPQDRIPLPELGRKFFELLRKPTSENGYAKSPDDIGKRYPTRIGLRTGESSGRVAGGGRQETETAPVPSGDQVTRADTSVWTETEMVNNRPTASVLDAIPAQEFPRAHVELGDGDVVIAAITSCTNTSNPSVMLAAGLVARKAVELGLSIPPYVKASLAPGSRVVSDYLERTGLQQYLDWLGFNLVGYGCTTCIGNSGPLDPRVEETVTGNDLVVASVLSGNRNFEARVHQSVRANFLMSPPLVVAFALAGRVGIDLTKEPIGQGLSGRAIYLHELWPSMDEIGVELARAHDPESYRRLYRDFAAQNPMWDEIPSSTGTVYEWDKHSTYIQEPPFFEDFSMVPEPRGEIRGARALAIFGDSVTTDHISPAGSIKPTSPAGLYLQAQGVTVDEFNSYGSRRGNDRVMTRGTFANVRIKNLMVPGTEGGITRFYPGGEQMSIYDAALKYQKAGVPLIVLAGQEYGTGSSRDWAAKGTRLLGVSVVVAQSFERIHRSNLVGMGVAPCQFKDGPSIRSLGLDGSETFDLLGLEHPRPLADLVLRIHRVGTTVEDVPVTLRIDTPIEVEYYRHGGILAYVLRQLIQR
jgi:aconitate hydratase